MHTGQSIDRSKLWLQALGGAVWLGGAAFSESWMAYGGVVKPLVWFALWAGAISFAIVRTIDATTNVATAVKKALRYGGYSTAVLALGTLFVEYWPVTVSMACMFAICRTFKNEDAPAYI